MYQVFEIIGLLIGLRDLCKSQGHTWRNVYSYNDRVRTSCYVYSSSSRVTIILYILVLNADHGSTVFKVPCYKSEGRWFDSR